MTKLLQRLEITLRSFYIFNSSLGHKEGEEHKKILYYHPNDIELNTKIKDVGLSEAIIAFTGTFTSEDDCQALHTQKTTQLFYQPEPGYWLVMVLNVPKEIRLKEGVEVADYRGGEVSDRLYRAVLRQCYHIYCFQYGKLAEKLINESEQLRLELQEELLQFYEKYLPSLNDLSHCDIMDMLHSIQYLALDKTLFLRAHNFSMLCANFPVIKECIMLYNEQVLCGGKLSPGDLYSLHGYMVKNVLKTEETKPIEEGFVGGETPTAKRVYLTFGPHYLVSYRAQNVTLCLFFEDLPQTQLFEELHSYMAPQLNCLARDIALDISKENVNQTSTNQDSSSDNAASPKFLFINEQSLQHHTNIYRHAQHLPRNVMSIIADLANPIENLSTFAATEELQVKTTNDYWIVKRRCNWRQYYVILCNSKATLLDVTQEAKRIFEQELTDDVFFDK